MSFHEPEDDDDVISWPLLLVFAAMVAMSVYSTVSA